MAKKKLQKKSVEAVNSGIDHTTKKRRFDVKGLVPLKPTSRTPEEVEKALTEAIKKHPFYDNADHIIDFHGASVFRDSKGAICGVLLPGALPAFAATMAADVLRPAAVRTSLRSNMFGGLPPLSGIAGYFDYRGSPVELKCRKTTFTCEHIKMWPNVFPMIDYVDKIYRTAFPEQWAAQHAAVPDIVRIHGSSFSTLTINQQFRTASHTDAGDFDMGYGLMAVLEGNYKGVALALDDFGVCFCMQPRDVLIFNTHFFHSNTEPELDNPKDDWDRLTCVFYYRAALGEPACVAEYKRRLLRAKELGAFPPPVVDDVVQKENGDNFNKPAPIFPPPLTPFGGAAGARSLHGCAAQLLRLHELLLEQPMLSVVLFGEPLQTDNGLPQRGKDQLIPVHLPVVFKMPSGGFSETSDVLKAAEEKQYFFEDEGLASELGPELMNIWTRSRALWLQLVREDWEGMCQKNPDRANFTWNNYSTMNAAFFDLCEVAKQVMLALLEKETPTTAEEHSFWVLFAAHLSKACVTENGMPPSAIDMHKLNVKLKDFHFGGTRYLKDMPPEEQKRRLERKRHIEEVRRRNVNTGVNSSKNWLQNDSFDYQHEDKEVYFEKNGWPTPEENVKRLGLSPFGDAVVAADPTEVINVLVVLPRPAASSQKASLDASPATNEESARLLMNPAAQRLLAEGYRNNTAPSSFRFGGVTITVVFDTDDVKKMEFDFIILQHVLASMDSDKRAEARVNYWLLRARYALFVVETDLMDRRHFLLLDEIRTAYKDVAEACFRKLHAAAYSTDSIHLRSTPSLMALMKTKKVEARYKFSGSPLNTVAFLVVKDI